MIRNFIAREWKGAREDPWGALLMFLVGIGLGVLALVVLTA